MENLQIKNKYEAAFLSLLVLFLGILFASPLARAEENQDKTKLDATTPYKEQIEADGYEYTYEAVPDPNQDDREKIRYVGKITIQDKHNNIFYQETTDLEPGDGEDFPRLSKWPVKVPNKYYNDHQQERWLVAIYGHYFGRQNTMRIFFRDSNVRTTSLEFGDTVPNLQRTEDGGGYTAQVTRRILFPNAAGGLANCLTVYKLQVYNPIVDHALFGFIPVFGPDMAKPYLENYMWYKESLGLDKEPNAIPLAVDVVSALIATQDKKMICKEIKAHKRFGLTDNQFLSLIEQLKDVGYPGFNPTDCKVK